MTVVYHSMLLTGLIVALGFPQLRAEAPSDSPQFRGPGGLGISTDTGLPLRWNADENVAWKVELPGAGTSAPIVFGDRIYVACYSGYNVPGEEQGDQKDLRRKLVCLSRGDGKLHWSQEVPSRLPEQERIRDDHGYASSTPAADADGVFAFFGKSGAFAFDHKGKRLWHAEVGEGLSDWGSAASPVLFENLVIVNASVESQSMVALDKKTGDEVWKVEGIRESWNTPLLARLPGGKVELVVAIQGKILAFDPRTGESLWSCDTDITWYMVPCLIADEGIIYCLGGRSGVAALAVRAGGRGDVTKSHRLWTGNKGSNVSSPVFHERHLYWMNDSRGIAYCAVARTGEIVYEERVGRIDQVYASPLLAEGRIYHIARDGKAVVLAAKPQFEILAENTLGERGAFNSGLVAAGGRLYLRSNRFLYCLENKSG